MKHLKLFEDIDPLEPEIEWEEPFIKPIVWKYTSTKIAKGEKAFVGDTMIGFYYNGLFQKKYIVKVGFGNNYNTINTVDTPEESREIIEKWWKKFLEQIVNNDV